MYVHFLECRFSNQKLAKKSHVKSIPGNALLAMLYFESIPRQKLNSNPIGKDHKQTEKAVQSQYLFVKTKESRFRILFEFSVMPNLNLFSPHTNHHECLSAFDLIGFFFFFFFFFFYLTSFFYKINSSKGNIPKIKISSYNQTY